MGPALHPPLRLDLDAARVLTGIGCLAVRARAPSERTLAASFHGALPFLSVRSAFCAWIEAGLRAGRLQPGDEIVMTALNIDDMPRIAESYGLVVVPVGVDAHTLAPPLGSLAARIGPRTRAVLVAHLFGARVELDAIAALCAQHEVALLEDCAQAFAGLDYAGHAGAALSMFSFGLLKTKSALGGALCVVRDPRLRSEMDEVQRAWPVQSRAAWARKLFKVLALLPAQHPLVYGALDTCLGMSGRAVGDVLRAATRGFSPHANAPYADAFRKQPCAPLLALLARTIASRGAERRLRARAEAGEEMRAALGRFVVGADAHARTHWLLAIRAADPTEVQGWLRRVGVDASRASNISAVGGDSAPYAMRELVDQLVFVPVYPELPARVRADIVAALRAGIEGEGEPTDAPPRATGATSASC